MPLISRDPTIYKMYRIEGILSYQNEAVKPQTIHVSFNFNVTLKSNFRFFWTFLPAKYLPAGLNGGWWLLSNSKTLYYGAMYVGRGRVLFWMSFYRYFQKLSEFRRVSFPSWGYKGLNPAGPAVIELKLLWQTVWARRRCSAEVSISAENLGGTSRGKRSAGQAQIPLVIDSSLSWSITCRVALSSHA